MIFRHCLRQNSSSLGGCIAYVACHFCKMTSLTWHGVFVKGNLNFVSQIPEP